MGIITDPTDPGDGGDSGGGWVPEVDPLPTPTPDPTPDPDPPSDGDADAPVEGDPFTDASGNPVTNGAEYIREAVSNARAAGNDLLPSQVPGGTQAFHAANAHVEAMEDRARTVASQAGVPWQWVAAGVVAAAGAVAVALGGGE